MATDKGKFWQRSWASVFNTTNFKKIADIINEPWIDNGFLVLAIRKNKQRGKIKKINRLIQVFLIRRERRRLEWKNFIKSFPTKYSNKHHKIPKRAFWGKKHKRQEVKIRVPIKTHESWHNLFGIKHPNRIASLVNNWFPQNNFKLIAINLEEYAKQKAR